MGIVLLAIINPTIVNFTLLMVLLGLHIYLIVVYDSLEFLERVFKSIICKNYSITQLKECIH
jgi:hypothetical protein